MTITKGSKVDPTYSFQYIDAKSKEPASISTAELEKGLYVLVGVPAAFSPPCSEQHLPSYIANVDTFAERGAKILVIDTDNLFANRAWSKSFNVDDKQDKILFVSDVGGKYLKSIGLTTNEVGPLGEVSARFAAVVKDGVFFYVGKEESVGFVDASSAEKLLAEYIK
ncbi:hypothetical protein WICMUC_000951 [Wickerhamomyces mucosus]|uniref:Thioredoxin domain-containing protein n=1 Tax=Wickerhamomyces mucosus TaxID=1378264 RepID=A0A9P8TIC5_9ASCO|nr:hypothetical protein WICMUC_000951 [Wickerhamomyces mucosus]